MASLINKSRRDSDRQNLAHSKSDNSSVRSIAMCVEMLEDRKFFSASPFGYVFGYTPDTYLPPIQSRSIQNYFGTGSPTSLAVNGDFSGLSALASQQSGGPLLNFANAVQNNNNAILAGLLSSSPISQPSYYQKPAPISTSSWTTRPTPTSFGGVSLGMALGPFSGGLVQSYSAPTYGYNRSGTGNTYFGSATYNTSGRGAYGSSTALPSFFATALSGLF